MTASDITLLKCVHMEATSISPGKIPRKRLTKTYAQHYWLQKKTWTGITEKLSKRVMHNATAFRKKVWTTTSEELWTQKRYQNANTLQIGFKQTAVTKRKYTLFFCVLETLGKPGYLSFQGSGGRANEKPPFAFRVISDAFDSRWQ